MAIWKCKNCGDEKDVRCKPKKCPVCNGQDKDQFTKAEPKK